MYNQKGASFMAKNKDNASPAAEQTNPQKDYQQEEDQESKSKKLRKTIIAIVLFIVIFFVILAIWWINEHRVKEVEYDVNGRAQEVFAQAEENTENVEVKGSLLDLTGPTVDVVVPVEYFQGKAPTELTAAEKNSGYVALKQEGSNIVYTLRTSYYPSIVENMYEHYCDSFNELYERKNKVELVSMNRVAQVFTITIEKLSFNPNNYYDMLRDLYYQAAVYQCFYGYTPDNIKVTFQFKYHQEQFVFTSYTFPDSLGKTLS